MSFSTEVKNELLKIESEPCCIHARNYGILLFGRAFSPTELSLLTANQEIAECYCNAVWMLSGTKVSYSETAGKKYKIHIEDTSIIDKVFDNLGIDKQAAKKRINFANFQDSCCFASFLAGAFLVCGRITNPEKDYHLEFSISSKSLCDDFLKIFDEYEVKPKLVQRNGSYTLYLKNSSDIEYTLALIGAQNNFIYFTQTKIEKNIKNHVNRQVNFDSANLVRTINAATEQYNAIATIYATIGEENLPPELREIARIRYENREISNSQVAQLLSESLSLSGVNHRFKRLIKIAQELKK